MVNWNKYLPFSNKGRTLEASHAKGYKIQEESKGQTSINNIFNKDVIRVPHPDNMGNYEDWGKDPEARVALEVLTNIIAGVGYYTEMDEEYQPKKEGDHPHKNKVIVDDYGEDINLDEKLQDITYRYLHKGFCAVETYASADSQYDIKLLPSEEIFKYIDKKGHLLKYTQERSHGAIIAEWKTPEEINSIIWFQFGPGRYGMSLLDPIGDLLDSRAEMNMDMPKAIHRWAYPIPIMETSGPKADLQKACEDRDIDEWIFIGNANDGEVRWKTLEINPQARFIPYIELIYYQIAEGLHAPLLLYLKNATEASATVMMESVDRLVYGRQRYNKRRVERYLFKLQTGDPVPKIIWGQPKTGLEDVTLGDLAQIIPFLANNQQQHILKQYLGSLPEPDWKEDSELSKLKAPMLPQGNIPFQKKQEPAIATEKLLEHLNDMQTGLTVIADNFHEGKLGIAEACKLADRTISVHMKRLHGSNWIDYRDTKFQEFVAQSILKVGKEKYTVTVD